MSKELLTELTRDFCTLAHLSEPEKLMEGNAVEVNGIDFYLGYDAETDPDYLIVYCDFGLPPKERLLEAYQALLEVNMTVYGSHAPAFMLSPAKKVALAYHYWLGEVTPEQLMGLFVALAEQANAWRAHHFLDVAA